jgi:cell division protein FtsI/penicillin-binding protein 2
MSELRNGLTAVITAGTAHTQFAGRSILRFSDGGDRRVFGKTGTADTLPGMNTALFAGWIEPDRDPKKKGIARRRLAFACSVSHVARGQFGAGVCGLLTAEILQALDIPKPP